MLIIVMHNRMDYLESLLLLAGKEHVANARIIDRREMGFSLSGGSEKMIFRKGRLCRKYDKALMIAVKDEEETRRLLELMENDVSLRILNIEERGFVCTIPFQQILDLKPPQIETKDNSDS